MKLPQFMANFSASLPRQFLSIQRMFERGDLVEGGGGERSVRQLALTLARL